MPDAVCTVDVGTTRTKGAFVDDRGELLALADAPTPGAGAPGEGLAVDPEAVLATVYGIVRQLVGRRPDAAVQAVCVTNQRATVLALDEERRPLAALSWQDPRAEDARAELAECLDEERFRDLTGLPHSTIWSATKIRWLRGSEPSLVARAGRFALVHDDLLERLGAPEPLIDPSNASPTGLWELARGRWCPELLALVEVEEAQLPRVVPAGSVAGPLSREASRETGLPESTPLVVGGGDQPCAALGLGVLEPGQVALSLGTAADVLSPVAGVAAPDPARICTAHVVEGQTMLEGFLGAFGASLAWVRSLVGRAPDEAGCDVRPDTPLYLPFLGGVATPDFAPAVRGGLLGLQPDHGARDLIAAVKDGLAMELRRILASRATVDGVEELVVARGGAGDESLLRRIADVTGVRLVTSPIREAALRGAAALAFTGVDRFDSVSSAGRAFADVDAERLDPAPRAEWQDERYARYLGWVETLLEGRRLA